MEDHGDPLTLDGRPEGTEPRLVQIPTVDRTADLEALEAQHVDGAVQLGDGEIDVLKRNSGSHGDESVRVGFAAAAAARLSFWILADSAPAGPGAQ